MSHEFTIPAAACVGRVNASDGRPPWLRTFAANSRLVLAATLALGIALRLFLLGRNSLWFDETFVYHVAAMPWADMFAHLGLEDAHPPLYYAMMKVWIGLAGDREVAMRLPSACFSAIAIWLSYLLARRLSSEACGVLAALVVAVSPFDIMAGQEARMYPLLAVLALSATLLLLECVEQGGFKRWAWYTTVLTAMIYTHYFGFLIVGAHGLWMLRYRHHRVVPWLGAVAAAGVLFAPWLPTLWYQAANGHVWAWYRAPVTPSMLGDLFSMYAFGGSLFGFGTYFRMGSVTPIEALIVLLPFLVVLWWGVRALVCRPGGGALIGLVFAAPIAVMFVLSFWKPMFYPRWFSFLVPFYAILLAAGMISLAGRFGGRRGWNVLAIALGLVVYSVPVLTEYYFFNQAYRPYDWRGAATMVQSRVRPGDLFLYNISASRIAFTYYDRDPVPSLTLTPIEALAPGHRRATFDAAWVRRLSARYPRVWIIATVPFSPEMQHRLQAALETSYSLVDIHDFRDVWVTLVQAKDRHAAR